MYRGFFVHWRVGSVFGQFDYATGYSLQFPYVLATLANDTSNLEKFQVQTRYNSTLSQ